MSGPDRGSWVVVVPTRGDRASIGRIEQNIVARLAGVPVVVVRNGKGDPAAADDRAWLRLAARPHVTVTDHRGGGVSRARNGALASADARTLVFVDDDVVVTKEALQQLVDRQRAHCAAVSTARVVPLPSAHASARLFELYLGFDRGPVTRTWSVGDGTGDRLSPLNVWELGVGATFAVDRERLGAPGGPAWFDERLSNGRFCGGTEDVDFFYRVYLAGSTVSYVAEAVVEHIFPDRAYAVSAKCRQYALSDGAFYAKWVRHVSPADLQREFTGWARRVAHHARKRLRGQPAVSLSSLLTEPVYKLAGGASWLLLRLRPS